MWSPLAVRCLALVRVYCGDWTDGCGMMVVRLWMRWEYLVLVPRGRDGRESVVKTVYMCIRYSKENSPQWTRKNHAGRWVLRRGCDGKIDHVKTPEL